MLKTYRRIFPIVTVFLLLLAACSDKTAIPTFSPPPEPTPQAGETPAPTPVMELPTAEPTPTRVLSVCLGQEPASLFLYAAGMEASGPSAASSVFQAIYDGPVDTRDFSSQAVILADIPSFENGGARLETVSVNPGDLIIDNEGSWANLAEGVVFRPAGCTSPTCAQTYTGSDPVNMEFLVVRFTLLPDLRWSDGAPLTAADSVYSFEIAKSLFPAYRADLINLTQSYTAVDDQSVEWKSPPGYQSARFNTFFFSPLPQHVWGTLTPEELASAPPSSQTPLGWGPYAIDEWVPGDHISLHKNPNYFRAADGLPHFDQLVFRFVSSGKEALEALQAGECDLADGSALLETEASQVFQLQDTGQLTVSVQVGTAWEQAVFGINPLDEKKPRLFAQKEVRQAIAQCVDRQAMADALFKGHSVSLDSYILPQHPLVNPEAPKYAFDPEKANQALTSAGWLDLDSDPATPRVSQGVPGVQDGTPFEFTYLTTDDPEKVQAAGIFQESLARCGIRASIQPMPFEELLAPGPEGLVFGRNFDMAQFGWTTTFEPPCSLYLSSEVPGPYPASPKGWGGANASGFASPEFDQACQLAGGTFPNTPEYTQAAADAQAIFAEELPAIPLYARINLTASRPDLCGLVAGGPSENALWNLENLDYGEGCP